MRRRTAARWEAHLLDEPAVAPLVARDRVGLTAQRLVEEPGREGAAVGLRYGLDRHARRLQPRDPGRGRLGTERGLESGLGRLRVAPRSPQCRDVARIVDRGDGAEVL